MRVYVQPGYILSGLILNYKRETWEEMIQLTANIITPDKFDFIFFNLPATLSSVAKALRIREMSMSHLFLSVILLSTFVQSRIYVVFDDLI